MNKDVELYKELLSKNIEDEIKSFYLRELNIPLCMPHLSDNYSENIIFEFKYQEDLRDNPKILTQAIYYCNSLYVNGEHVPSKIALIDKDEVSIYETKIFKGLYTDIHNFSFGAPNNPDIEVVNKVKSSINDLYWYIKVDSSENLHIALKTLKSLLKSNKISAENINQYNVKRAYEGYIRSLGDYLLNESASKGVYEFRADAIGKATIKGNSLLNEYTIFFQFSNGAKEIEHINVDAYNSYWARWKRIKSESEAIEVFKKIYDLLNLSDKRTKGLFYTPMNFAKISWDKTVSVIGENFWEDGSWRIWDCCAGTGNLEYGVFPESVYKYTYLSTLDIEEVDQLQQKLGGVRGVFQFDFLNDNFKRSLPNNLQKDLSNPDIKWLIFINPPYVESQGKSNVEAGVSYSNIKEIMDNNNLSDAAREVFAQFLYNIETHFQGKYYLGLFSKAKFISSSKFKNFRLFWQPKFLGGYVVNAKEHFKKTGNWPVIFSIFDCTTKEKKNDDVWKKQEFIYEVGDKNLTTVGTKKFSVYDESRKFRELLPKNAKKLSKKVPIVKSAIAVPDVGQRINTTALVPSNFIATMVFISQELQQQNRCFLTSGNANTNHNNTYLTTDNYLKILLAFGLYKSVNVTYLEDRDSILYPNREFSETEKDDIVLYSLLCPANYTATYKFEDGESIINLLNPLDTTMFAFDNLSIIGLRAFEEMTNYLNNIVKWQELSSSFGTGKWLGFYQYRTDHDLDHKDCFGFKYPDSFTDSIEKLRERVEVLVKEVCM